MGRLSWGRAAKLEGGGAQVGGGGGKVGDQIGAKSWIFQTELRPIGAYTR